VCALAGQGELGQGLVPCSPMRTVLTGMIWFVPTYRSCPKPWLWSGWAWAECGRRVLPARSATGGGI